MSRARANPDGLPFRVYERYGLRVYSIGYKLRSGRWAFRYKCSVTNGRQIANLRREAIVQATKITDDAPIGGFAGLVTAWFEWQKQLPERNGRKCAASTIAENRREADNLVAAWGHFEPREITKTMGYEYLAACEVRRPEKGNKEMALARKILEFGISRGLLQDNPLKDLAKNKVNKDMARWVSAKELALAVEIGRKMGGPYHIVATALKTAWLCVRRSVEVRAVTREAITDQGMLWKDGKDRNKPAALIEWTDELRNTIDEALALKRYEGAGTMYLFGNMRGQRYTKGGWKKVLHNLMIRCEAVAKERNEAFARFSLQDCRPMGISDKLENGDNDVQNATLHTDGKMIATVYDRRKVKRAKPAK